ncbi:putative polyhydroxyalkanoic acid system protein [Variibacter gotjawalensis]|uniref:Putative polyhydroxyalkanoic acid system protein n=1 Tax=Variibacter gotjawalensis TaxID=1333996 RepID=A0A0S3PRZ6_9BRAD|nr:polyhydroxyalkanoic acid system family protein [Variibacter gotjawalensis]NIK49021.1 putative polyhydroxyalkanoate system protein [Variibacter gotjawalensis]RZS50877.1 putative polyhydroxyalkanoate system protein [Variibacter gotjawalensis]BAT58711.1 putative polyhydroxyalkanoic acid system protein [Variibacter gotjawalensis]
MAKVEVSIPHSLGKDEAARRIKAGLEKAQGGFAGLTLTDQTWTGDTMVFKAGAMGQSVPGEIDVAEQSVRIAVDLPFFLAAMAETAKGMIEKQGQLLLEKK